MLLGIVESMAQSYWAETSEEPESKFNGPGLLRSPSLQKHKKKKGEHTATHRLNSEAHSFTCYGDGGITVLVHSLFLTDSNPILTVVHRFDFLFTWKSNRL